MSRFYIASDYAGVSGGGFSFYYGYEETVGDEWCFVAKEGGKLVLRIPESKLGVDRGAEMAECLLAGIAKWLEERA